MCGTVVRCLGAGLERRRWASFDSSSWRVALSAGTTLVVGNEGRALIPDKGLLTLLASTQSDHEEDDEDPDGEYAR